MTRRLPALILAPVYAASLCVGAGAQTPSATPLQTPSATPSQTPSGSRTPRKATSRGQKPAASESDGEARLRRDTAVMLLTELAAEARGYEDRELGARVRMRAADSLWASDEEAARALFREAWEAAESPALRGEVLSCAARRDHSLGEEFLGKMVEAEESKVDAAGPAPARPDPSSPPPASAQRLELARLLLQKGETAKAVALVGPALARATVPGVQFLLELRRTDADAADRLYEEMLRRAALDPNADANDASLLSSYVLTPDLFFTTTNGGTSTFHSRGGPARAEPPARVRAAFFAAAARILMRDPPQPDAPGSVGRNGTFVIIARLLPFFEKYDAGRVASLRARLASLSSRNPEEYSAVIRERLGEGGATKEAQNAEQRDPLEELEGVTDPDRRDEISARAAVAAVRDGKHAAAREAAEKIQNEDLRRRVRAYVAFFAARAALDEEKNVERALEWARGADLTLPQRLVIYTGAARLLKGDDPTRAAQLLDEAAAEARRADKKDAERARGLLAVASVWLELDRARAWELTTEAVESANAAEDFKGDDSGVTTRLHFGNTGTTTSYNAQGFDIAEIFRALAKENPNLAASIARGLKGEAARSNALLAVALALLEPVRRPAPPAPAKSPSTPAPF